MPFLVPFALPVAVPLGAPAAAPVAIPVVSTLVHPIRVLVEHVLVASHDVLTDLGLDPVGAAWSFAVVVLVVLVRVVLLPLVVRQVRGAHAMALVQPRLQQVQARYRGRTDPASRRALVAEQQALLGEAGASPLAGCLPALAQAPVLYALYLTLAGLGHDGGVGPLTGALAQQAGAATLWGAPLAGTLGAAASTGALVVGIVLAVVLCGGQALAGWLATRNRPPVDPEVPMARLTTTLPVVLPLVMAVAAVHVPLGVVLYWATSALWSVGQQLVVDRVLPHPGRAGRRAGRRV
ncbi:membrane protein insertase YidC [Cellulomonas iranensis]|uniref:Membrane protein insertase YidC n=1 Tax=Cellulomonas iranensis TaxID=76862 RepID=A0ABU0GP90_9CELL|nr:membrane protein insertase YidC [Cellulomonas iranensis]MDQ0426415.1 YidC/Oxa1 family membrane protein insertase [Cellulomonas iranensis]